MRGNDRDSKKKKDPPGLFFRVISIIILGFLAVFVAGAVDVGLGHRDFWLNIQKNRSEL